MAHVISVEYPYIWTRKTKKLLYEIVPWFFGDQKTMRVMHYTDCRYIICLNCRSDHSATPQIHSDNLDLELVDITVIAQIGRVTRWQMQKSLELYCTGINTKGNNFYKFKTYGTDSFMYSFLCHKTITIHLVENNWIKTESSTVDITIWTRVRLTNLVLVFTAIFENNWSLHETNCIHFKVLNFQDRKF